MSRNNKNLDPVHMIQIAFEEDSEAFRVKLADAEINMELNSEDGDSVIARKDFLVMEVQAHVMVDVKKYSKICVYSDNVVMHIQTDSGLILANKNIVQAEPIEILAPNVSFDKACTIVLRG